MRWTLYALLAAAASAGLAQQPSQADFAAGSAMRKALRQGCYFAADDALRPLAFSPDGTPIPGFVHDRWTELQSAFTGEPGPAAVEGITRVRSVDARASEMIAAAKSRDAIAAIVERARRTRLVILNEDHASPRDRAFGLQVAKALKPLGYDVLGIETLTNVADEERAAAAMTKLRDEGYPRFTTGTYLSDPVFADFLRQSLAIGYHPVAYEATDSVQTGDVESRMDRREQAQADYVVKRALNARPASKVLLYVGFFHAAERPKIEGRVERRWLASRLKEMTGIDPVTIDQTTFNEYAAGDPALYRLVADRSGPKPTVLFYDDKPLVVGEYAGLVDLQIVHPRTKRIGERPTWLRTLGRKPNIVPSALLPSSGRRLVQAFIASERGGIPVDQVIVEAGRPSAMLMLPRTQIRYAVQDRFQCEGLGQPGG